MIATVQNVTHGTSPIRIPNNVGLVKLITVTVNVVAFDCDKHCQ